MKTLNIGIGFSEWNGRKKTWNQTSVANKCRGSAAFVHDSFHDGCRRGCESVLEKTVRHFVFWQANQSKILRTTESVIATTECERIARQEVTYHADAFVWKPDMNVIIYILID